MVVENGSVDLNDNESSSDYPLFDSCFNALSLEAANYINILPNLIFIYSLCTNLADVLAEVLVGSAPVTLAGHLAQLIDTVNNRFLFSEIRVLATYIGCFRPPLIRLISIRMTADIIQWMATNLPDQHHEMIKSHVKGFLCSLYFRSPLMTLLS